MQIRMSLRTLSLSLATASFLVAGSALAQNSGNQNSGNQNSAAQNSENQNNGSYELAGVTARLDHALDAKDAHPGQMIEAKLDRQAKTPEGVVLPKGTELCGKVDQVQAGGNGSPAKVSIRFNEARLNDGKTVPVRVVVLGAYPASENTSAMYGVQTMGPAPRRVSAKESVDQKAGILHDISMHSDMKGHDSATFIDRKGDLKLHAGTYLQMGIAPRNMSNNMSSGA